MRLTINSCVGNYYLCNNGYTNSPSFLSPFRGVCYYLDGWGPSASRQINYQDMRHTRARNIIERAFGVLKMRQGNLQSPYFYPIHTQICLLMAYFLLHNFICGEMVDDPMEAQLDVDVRRTILTKKALSTLPPLKQPMSGKYIVKNCHNKCGLNLITQHRVWWLYLSVVCSLLMQEHLLFWAPFFKTFGIST